MRAALAAIMAISAVAGPAAARAADIATTPIAGTRLDVTAQGEVRRAPDIATVTAGVVTQAPGAAAAMAENARRVAAATAALRRAGVAERDIRTASLSLQPQYRYDDGRAPTITGYQASNQLSVTFRDVARTGSILDALVGAGVNQIGGPDFALEKPDAALDEARTQALATARARADLYAKAAGLQVARIVAIDEQSGYAPPQPPRPMMMMARVKSADTEIAPGEEKIGVALAVTFELR